MQHTILIKNVDSIDVAAEKLLKLIPSGSVVALYGQMGAGKTTLIREMCTQLGVNQTVTSPTFSIVNEYTTGSGQTIYHFDLYRIKTVEEAFDFGCEEYLFSGSTCFVEWPEKIAEILPEETIRVDINVIDEDERELVVEV